MGDLTSVLKIAAGVVLGLCVFAGLAMCSAAVLTGAALEAADEASQQALERQRARNAESRRQREAAESLRVQREWQAAQERTRQAAIAEASEKRNRDARHAAALRDDVEGRYYALAVDSMKPGTYACKDRVISLRTGDGWQPTFKGDGLKAKCRTDP